MTNDRDKTGQTGTDRDIRSRGSAADSPAPGEGGGSPLKGGVPLPGSEPDERAREVAGIEDALDELLRAAIAADELQARRREPGPLKALSVDEVVADLDRSLAARNTEGLIRNPVGWACRMAIHQLGKRLHELGGTALMEEVCDRVSARDEARLGYRESIIDHRWNGIGEWWA